jgi:vacuolar-type H+-ATPase subunit I/STV1
MTKRDGKLIAATFTVMGIIFTVFGELFGPEKVIWHKDPWYGNFSGKLGWFLVLIAPLIYIILDWGNIFPKKK